ncbi:hypothetical protein D3C75_656630 [compost metagenome]
MDDGRAAHPGGGVDEPDAADVKGRRGLQNPSRTIEACYQGTGFGSSAHGVVSAHHALGRPCGATGVHQVGIILRLGANRRASLIAIGDRLLKGHRPLWRYTDADKLLDRG